MSFQEDLATERITQLCLRDAIAINEHAIIRAAVALMRTSSLGCAVIVDAHQKPTGIFTEQSVIRAIVADTNLDETPVSEFTDPLFMTVRDGDPVKSVWDAVIKKGVRFACVTDAVGRLVGITGQRGLSEFVCETFAKQITVQRLGSSPWMLEREGA